MTLFKHLFSLQYYHAILVGGGGLHPLVIAFLLAFLSSIVPSFEMIRYGYPVARNFSAAIDTFANRFVPDDLEVTIKDGVASTNVREPYVVSLKASDLQEALSTLQIPVPRDLQKPRVSATRLLVIDTKANAEHFEQYQAAALLTANTLVYFSEGEMKLVSLRETPNLTINKAFIQDKVKILTGNQTLMSLVVMGVFLLPVFLLVGGIILNIVFFVFLTLAVWGMAKILSVPSPYRRLYRVTTNLSLIPMLVWMGLITIPRVGPLLSFSNGPAYAVALSLAYIIIKNAGASRTIVRVLSPVLMLPLLLVIDAWRSPRSIWKKLVISIVVLLTFGLAWKNGYANVYEVGRRALFEAGVTDRLTNITVRGTSMLPTVKDSETINLHSPKKYPPQRGDIISFTNDETEGLHYLKRVIGLPGENITIKNGLVWIDGQPLQESYILNRIPTYGNSFIVDCETQRIPDGAVIALGDNRTVSHDSRAIGFVTIEDITGVIKTDTTPSFSTGDQRPQLGSSEPLSAPLFLKALNDRRIEQQMNPLATHGVLNELAGKRASQISANLDDWKLGSFPVEQMLEEHGYRFNLVHEFTTFGFLDAQGVVDQIIDAPREKDLFFSDQFTEAGIGIAQATKGECTFPVISVIISWPSVPTYDQSVINHWSTESETTTQLLSNLQTYVGSNRVDQEKLRTLISNIAESSVISARIANKMKSREWLSQQDYSDIRRYDTLVQASNQLLEDLFGPSVKGLSTESRQWF